MVKPKPSVSSRSWDRSRSRNNPTRGGGYNTSRMRDGDSSRTLPQKKKKRKSTKHNRSDNRREDNKREDRKSHRGEYLSRVFDAVGNLENSPPCSNDRGFF